MKELSADSIFEYRRATIEDIDELVRTRIIVLRAANKLSDAGHIISGHWQMAGILHIWCMIMKNLLVQALSAFIR